jgi:hypothetical protein
MSVNNPEVQILQDGAQTTIVKITGVYNALTNANTMIVDTSSLRFANTSQACYVSISKIEYYLSGYSTGPGVVQLYWEDASANTPIMNFGGFGSGGVFDKYITNNAPAPTGNIGLQVINYNDNDTYNFVLTLNKEAGYANAFIAYNDMTYRP